MKQAFLLIIFLTLLSGCGGGGGKTPVAPTTGSLQITTDPTGATLFLNGEKKGITPLTLSTLPAGTYTVKVTKDLYTSLEQSVEVQAGSTTTLNLTLTNETPPPAPF